jgi:hypothetical protein
MLSDANRKGTMSVIGLVSSSRLRTPARISAGLTWRSERNLKVRLSSRGIDIDYGSRRAFDLDLELDTGSAVDFAADIPPNLARRIEAVAAGGTDSFGLIELEAEEAERLARAVARAPANSLDTRIPIINAYLPRNGLLVPIGFIRQRLSLPAPHPQKGVSMSHPLQRCAPRAYDVVKQQCDDANKVIDEVILYEIARAQGVCKRIDHIKGNKPQRAKSLTEAEIDSMAKPYASEISRRTISEIREPLINPLPEGAFAFVPLLGQHDDANVVFFAAFVGHDSTRLALDVDEVLPAISRAVLEGLGRKSDAAA